MTQTSNFSADDKNDAATLTTYTNGNIDTTTPTVIVNVIKHTSSSTSFTKGFNNTAALAIPDKINY